VRRSGKSRRAASALARRDAAERRRREDLMEPISVRIPEAVRITGVSRSKLYELIKTRDIEVVKLGATTLVLTESLRKFIHALRG
jgi:excisionase family DNA binding protein